MSIVSSLISKSTNINVVNVEAVLLLLKEGATIPFISRYRKESTGGLDEVAIENIQSLNENYKGIQKRKEYILSIIDEQNKLTNRLKEKIDACWDATMLEDIYLPFRPKRKTRAEVARQKGLEGLAEWLLLQRNISVLHEAEKYLNKEIESIEEAIKGASDIIAEKVNEDSLARQKVRAVFARDAMIVSRIIKGKEEEGDKYKDYFDFEALLKRCPSHRLLAIRRGEAEGFLRVTISPNEELVIEKLISQFVRNSTEAASIVEEAVIDGYKRLMKPSIETEFATLSKKEADKSAIAVFADNLKQLLLAPPLGQKRILAIDPGFTSGCKIVCLDNQGNLQHNETIYPHPPRNEFSKAGNKVVKLVSMYNIDAIAIGNGTASRETERFITNLRYEKEIKVFVVNESGASVYSASKVAREEFPQYDVTVRGAVSIGRRLSDPLAELVKIDPKSIGVGQYQHDVDQTMLKKSLDQTVENCVNSVGVDLNTASKHLLVYVSGLGESLAQNIIDYRSEYGAFSSRKELMKVHRLGAKAFEQCAGFLRISNASNPLDNSAVHPESYHIVEEMAKDLNCTIKELIEDKTLRNKIDLNRYKTDKVGKETLADILKELEKPGRDPRSQIQEFEFDANVNTIDDLKEEMILSGVVTNITNFGCFVDIGIKENGLVHISELANRFVSNPSEIVSLQQYVKVKVLSVDKERKRIQLSMKRVEQ